MAQVRDEPAMWLARLRWRLRGAWQAPAFVVFTIVEAILLNRLPVAGEDALDPVAGFLFCGFVNLGIVGLCGPIGARLWRRRRDSAIPLPVLQDRFGVGGMSALALTILVTGIAHSGTVAAARDDYDVHLAAVRNYLAHNAPARYRSSIGQENVWKQGTGLYRTCVPGEDARHSYCLIVETGSGTPTVTPDDDQQPNDRIAGPDNPGRQGR